jgi:hypothetical protein
MEVVDSKLDYATPAESVPLKNVQVVRVDGLNKDTIPSKTIHLSLCYPKHWYVAFFVVKVWY